MIDLHCHLLPAVDDGSRSVEQSVAVLREMHAPRDQRRVSDSAPVGQSAQSRSLRQA